jgi:hypothetical protein
MTAIISIVVATVALGISATTLWLTLLRRGKLRMTLPNVIYFGADGGDEPNIKVYLRALLYSTAKRGWVVEGMYVRARRAETSQNFNIWVLGEEKLARGSGLFIGEVGVATNHHFLLPADGTDFKFLPGSYVIEVYATCVGDAAPKLLRAIRLALSSEHATAMRTIENGVYFDWGPDSNAYHAHVRRRPVGKPPE